MNKVGVKLVDINFKNVPSSHISSRNEKYMLVSLSQNDDLLLFLSFMILNNTYFAFWTAGWKKEAIKRCCEAETLCWELLQFYYIL